jgi:hypothetical protein
MKNPNTYVLKTELNSAILEQRKCTFNWKCARVKEDRQVQRTRLHFAK